MQKWLKRFQAWRAKRQQFSLERWERRQRVSLDRWERVRAKGKTRFIVRNALTLGVIVPVATEILDYLFDDGISFSRLLGRIIFFSAFGIPLAFSTWSNQETNYKNARLEHRMKALPPD